jgi:hypothetical protein
MALFKSNSYKDKSKLHSNITGNKRYCHAAVASSWELHMVTYGTPR